MAKESIGAFWTKTSSKDSSKFLSGVVTVGGVAHQVVVFKNTYKKEGSNEPDWRVYASEPKPELNPNGTEKVDDSEIPF